MLSSIDLLLVLSAVFILQLIIYRLFFHPLAAYPGPTSSALSNLPQLYAANLGRSHDRILELHLKHGNVVRYGPNSLSFVSERALNDIYVKKNANVVKAGWVESSNRLNGIPHTHTLINRTRHAAKRRLLSQAFSTDALRSAEGFIHSKISIWCERLAEQDHGRWSRSRNMADWSIFLSLDILSELCFGKSFETIEKNSMEIPSLLMASSKLCQQTAFLPFGDVLIPLAKRIGLFNFISSDGAREASKYRATLSEFVKQRVDKESMLNEKSPGSKDFYHYLLHAKDPYTGLQYTPSELVSEAALLVGAGTDTSAATLSALLYYLVNDPIVLSKLVNEIRATFGSIAEIKTGPQLSSMQYLRACVDEVLRICPPVPGVLERRVLKGGTIVDGAMIPAGTKVAVAANAIHHNKTYFREPFDFIPERWIEGSTIGDWTITRDDIMTARSAFCPFSLGSRGCVAKNMAYMELYLTMAHLLFLYDIRQMPGDKTNKSKTLSQTQQRTTQYKTRDWFITERDGPLIEFRQTP